MFFLYSVLKYLNFMRMLVGWKIFKYERDSGNLKNEFSYCGANLNNYTKKIFKKIDSQFSNMSSLLESNNKTIEIFTTASNILEIFIDQDIIEIRLTVWDENNTRCIVLEKLKITESNMKYYEKELKFVINDKNFKILFYDENDLKQFYLLFKKSQFTNASNNEQNVSNNINNYINNLKNIDVNKLKNNINSSCSNYSRDLLKNNFNNNLRNIDYNDFKINNININKMKNNNFIKTKEKICKYDTSKNEYLYKSNFINQMQNLNERIRIPLNSIKIKSKNIFIQKMKKLNNLL